MPSLPQTYRAAVFKEVNADLTIVDMQLKLPGPGEILVKVLASGTNPRLVALNLGDFSDTYRCLPHGFFGTERRLWQLIPDRTWT